MVAPVVIAAGIAAVSALAQAYNSEQARGASKKRLDEIKAAFDAIVPPEYDISINDPPQYIEQSLQTADIDFSKITPQQYKVIGQYSPEAAEYVAEAKPELVKGTAAQKEGREAQIKALRQMQEISRGESPELRIQMQRAADAAQAEAQSRQQSMLQDAQRRGQLGSGLTFASMLQGGSDAMQRGAAQSQDAAIAAYKDRLAAMQSAGQMGRQLSQDELSQEAGNVDILNAFNQRTTRAYQDYLSQRAAMQNQAQQFNLGQQQDIANRNVGAANEAQRFNLENRNRLAQQSYQNTRDERNYQNQLAQQRAAWAAGEKERQNQLKRQSYQDQMSRESARQGLGYQQSAQDMQAAQDRNAMISGIGQVATGYFNQQAEDERYDKYLRARYGSEPDPTIK